MRICTIISEELFSNIRIISIFNTLPLGTSEQGFPLKEQRHPDGSSIKLPFVAVVIVVGVVAVTGQLYPLQGRGVVGQLYPRQGRGVVG